MQYWFPERFAALEGAAAPPSETNTDESPLEALARALSSPSRPVFPAALQPEAKDLVNQVVERLRSLLHQGKLVGYYFEKDGRKFVSHDFWATAQADGVLESGTHWPFGKPARWPESRPNYSLLLLQAELDQVLSEELPEKQPFPRAKMPDLVAALRALGDLLNRERQREALRKLPEFQPYRLTDRIFREAETRLPRKPGRKPRPPEQ
jgi:hypothetical protein